MELKLGKAIEKLEFVAEGNYQTNIMDYLHIYSVHGVCQRSVQRTLLFTAYLVSGRLWPFALFCFAVSFSCLSYPLARIFAILYYLDLLFSPFLLFNSTIYQSLIMIG